MENLEKHYLILLTTKEQQSLEHFLQNAHHTLNHMLLYKPFELLQRKPYPVLDILLLQPPHVFIHIKWVIIATFEEILKQVSNNGITANFLKFLIRIPEDILNECLQGELRKTFRQSLHHSLTTETLYLSLLSRKDKTLIFDILEYLKETDWQYFRKPLGTKEFILYHALKSNTHFLGPMVREITEFKDIVDLPLRNNMIILKFVQELSMTNLRLEQLPKLENWWALIDLENVEEDLKPMYSHFYNDFKRLTILINYIAHFHDVFPNLTVEEILKTNTLLEIINKHKLLNSYNEAKEFIESYYYWQQNMPMISIKDKELEIICSYYILSTIFDIISTVGVAAGEEFYNQKINALKSLLREIKNFELLCDILEDVLSLTFIRWEYFNNDMQSAGKHAQKGSSDTSYTDDDILQDSSTKSSNTKSNTPKTGLKRMKTGFICKSKAFAVIFNFLKTFVTKKLHSSEYKNSASYIKERFQKTVDNITDLLWKFAFFEKMETSQNRLVSNKAYIHIEPECLVHFVHLHVNSKDRISSDDDDIHHLNHCLSRRKAAVKKRRRATFSGGRVTATPQEVLNLQQCRSRANILSSSVSCAEPLNQHSEIDNIDLPELKEDKGVIPKLLSSPERLAILALSHKQFDDAKQIIENFGLYNSQLNHELQFMERQQFVKQKLFTIYNNYRKQENQSSNFDKPLTTVEQIRNVAAKGFEVSKIISVIDNFAQVYQMSIRQREIIKDLIHKHKQNPQYRFLNQFEEANLSAVIISDLILSLPFNRDITISILMVIRRHQTIQSSFNDIDCISEKLQLPANIGPLHFLENLAECMGILGGGKSIKYLLCDNTYSLRPQKLAIELNREQLFLQIFHKPSRELTRCEDLKSLIPQFQSLKSKHNYYQRFCNYIQHLATLVHLRDPRCEYHIEELLKIDPCDVIGELIFTCNMTPLEIEANVTALNLNLVHVISLNICPEIVGKNSTKKPSASPEKESTILNYISNYNRLLVYVLRGINNGDAFSDDTHNGHINPCFLERLLNLPEMETLSSLYDGNKVISALRSDNISLKTLEQLKSKMEQLKVLQLEMGIQEPKAIRNNRIDSLIIELILEDPGNIYLASGIHDIAIRAKLIQENFTKIPTTRLAKELIETTLQHRHAKKMIPDELCQQLEANLVDITIYAKVSEVMQFDTWPQAYDFGQKTPTTIFERLLQLHLYKLCYEWSKVVKLSQNFIPQRQQFLDVLCGALMELVDEDHSTDFELNAYEYLLQILQTFPPDVCTKFLDLNKDKFRCIVLTKFSIDYLERCACDGEKNKFRNYKISILILEQLNPGIRKLFWNLLKYPLLIIEQLIMNAKFEMLTKVLTSVRHELLRADNESIESRKLCSYCFDKSGYISYIPPGSPGTKARFQLGSQETSNKTVFILLNFNLYQKDHFITNDCIDLILRIYATKALEYQISEINSEPCSQSTYDTQQSLDSLCGDFQMPSRPPLRSEWIRDEDASHCMCCRRTAFTMLMRRHHCRRCGRVVCFSCSTNRMRIPELYADVEVRICNDCHNLSADNNLQNTNRDTQSAQVDDVSNIPVRTRQTAADRFKWKLSGNITHDKLLREEFGYDHSPSVALCLSILEYHLGKQKCVDLLLYHCRKLEELIIPNPEVDYELVAKMMNCLALAAKVRGASAEFETIREDSEIIISVVQNGCESSIPPDLDPRKLADSLVQAERWDLALEIHLKYGFPTAGVMASHGLSNIRAGCFDTAREKFNHCMVKLTNDAMISAISKVIFSSVKTVSNADVDSILGLPKDNDISVVKRPHNGPPLLQEILKLIESLPFNKPQPETLQRASIIRTSNTSLAHLLSRRKEPYVKRMHEPALNILNTLANLKYVSKGQYSGNGSSSNNTNYPSNNNDPPITRKQLFRKTRGFEECLYYTLTYGSHTDVIQFLMNHQDLVASLKYFLLQKLDADIFINCIYLQLLQKGQVSLLIKHLLEFDQHLIIWRSTLLQTCRYLETQNLLNSLYELQVLLNDPIRAAMTCVKFYTMNCDNFQQQHANAQHLHNARMHLQSELESTQWENINFNTTSTKSAKNSSRRSSTSSTSNSIGGGSSFILQMDARSLNAHISTIVNQLEVSKFLAKCEIENSTKDTLITDNYLKKIRIESAKALPTLFDKVPEKILICVLILLCGKNIEEGFGLTYRIIQHYKLPPLKVYATVAKYLARNQRLPEVEKLLNCITSNNETDTRDIDEILSVAINSAVKNHEPETKTTLDILTKKIHNLEMRISSFIFIGQLKSAYLLANKYERIGDIRRILRQAEATNQLHIKKLCEKKLQISLSATSQK